jgi:hypothetical protein
MGAMDTERRRAIALFRFGVLGALVSARLEHGDRKALFEQAAKRDYLTPDGRIVRISARTIDTWYYAERGRRPVGARAGRAKRLGHKPLDERGGARSGGERSARSRVARFAESFGCWSAQTSSCPASCRRRACIGF